MQNPWTFPQKIFPDLGWASWTRRAERAELRGWRWHRSLRGEQNLYITGDNKDNKDIFSVNPYVENGEYERKGTYKVVPPR